MNRDLDLHSVLPQHIAIHDRLMNWSRYVGPANLRVRWGTQPMFRGYRSSDVWASECRIPVDEVDGHKIEKSVHSLPEKNRDALRWHYCFWYIRPGRVCRELAVSKAGLMELIHDGRSMLINRDRR